ncbi:signal transducer and activator of transcription 5B-like isoform X2 [Mya arenaria]|uniref:signal transducer and activator of transcription 5B-like isoform X2 n=1 Tax=Mya arenaria TaxID=6604 RepID=UPI0022E2120F|nr:signal transducer and activator of transcription 5B-like isoform X2 [Mya arenaria]
MALWARTQQLSADALRQVQYTYNSYFPIEIRHYFCVWIEEQLWQSIDDTQQAHEQIAKDLLTTLIQLIVDKANEETDFLAKLQMQDWAQKFQEMYSEQPMQFVKVVKMCLAKEEEMIRATDSMMSPSIAIQEVSENLKRDIRKQIEMIERLTSQSDQDLRRMQLLQENFVVDYQNHAQLSSQLQRVQQDESIPNRTELANRLRQQKDEMDRMLLASAQKILEERLRLAQKHKETLAHIETLQKKVVDEELITWKRRQQLALNGAPFDSSMIDIIQGWCESLADLIWRNRVQILRVDSLRTQLPIDVPDGYTDIQPELNQLVTGLLSSLVTSTFIVEQQPPQVLKKDARFSATVRLLVGGKLNLNMFPPRVKATIINEQQARGLLQSDESRRQQKCGDILNNEGQMDFHNATGQLSIVFRNMSLKNIKRADRRGAEVHTVAEEKFCLHFTSEFNVGGNELKFQTLSLPVIVTVHGNQECQATATYLWDNQFSEPGRIPFQVPDQVPWPEVASMLSTKFAHMTGRGLTEQNLRYLANKLFAVTGQQDFSQHKVAWAQFNKENLAARNFTFWEWFWSVGKLVREHLKGPWTDELIIGFMDKTESNDLLLSKPNGRFLLRFSDGTVGGITIAWVAENKEIPAGERQVWNLAPFTIKDFTIRGLADRIKDLDALVALYPDIPKDSAFGKYYSPAPDVSQGVTQGGYVKTTLITVLDGRQNMGNHTAGVMTYENPQTPQDLNHHPQSPGSTIYSRDIMSPSNPNLMDSDPFTLGSGPSSPDMENDPDFKKIREWLSESQMSRT